MLNICAGEPTLRTLPAGGTIQHSNTVAHNFPPFALAGCRVTQDQIIGIRLFSMIGASGLVFLELKSKCA